ncbi:MAG: ABC transporter permease [Rhodospirillales bacterium]|nr:ABC transporter permease [Rhodospirillales bacterium]
MVRTSLGFVALAVVCLFFADISITTHDPWFEARRMLVGVVTPDFLAFDIIADALLKTVAFALVGVALGAVSGFLLAQIFHFRIVRLLCAFVRAIHELFWALIFLQMLGLTPLTGILAIALPYAGICAKVYAETLEEAELPALVAVPAASSLVSTFFYVRLPEVWVHIVTYTSYRFECGLRSSAVLGFVGLPTLGFYLETAFNEGNYSEASALLITFYVLIASLRFWMRKRLIGLYLLVAPFLLGGGMDIKLSNITRFLGVDIVPVPLRGADLADPSVWSAFADWSMHLLADQALPGIIATLLLTQIALVGTAFLSLAFFPLISEKFLGKYGRMAGHLFLVVVRSTPEFILAYIFLQFWGPSMLPAIVALSLHNGAIIGHLMGRFSNEVILRPDHARGLNLYGFEVVPRIYGQFLAFLFYRWEVIMRETAILGILGIATLGFYVDSALADIRLDRALFLIAITALLNVGIDSLSRFIRQRLRLNRTVQTQ